MSGRDLERGERIKNNNNYPVAPRSYVNDPGTNYTSWLIPMFVVANVIVFIVAMYVNNCPSKDLNFQGQGHCFLRFLGRFSFQPLRENPMFGPSSLTLKKMGALKLDGVAIHHEGWRLITCIWLHAGVLHLAANMISLVLIGIRLEKQFGFVRIGIIYLVSGFGGSVLSSLFFRNQITLGASGALEGLIGALLSELITNWSIYTNKAAALFTLVFGIAVNLAIGLLPLVDNYAHIGGFLTGFLLGFIFLPRPQLGWLQQRHAPAAGVRNKSKYKVHQYVLWILSLVLLIAGLCIALVMLFRGSPASMAAVGATFTAAVVGTVITVFHRLCYE